MRPLDWRRLLDEHRITYIERGANVSRGELNIACPFCGSADPSYHLGLNLDTGWWACWRNQNHRGKSPVRLLVALLRISYWKARELAGLGADYVDPDGFDEVAARIMGRQQLTRVEEVRRDFLDLPKDYQPINKRTPSGAPSFRRWLAYLEGRGFPARDHDLLADQYLLKATHTGKFSDRIILPYLVNGEVVTWTGRAIADAEIRYRDLSREESLIPPKETFYNHDAIIEGGKALLVTEGPFDALKLDFYGRKQGVRAVALSTNSIREEQIFLLEEAAGQFDSTIVMLDTATSLGVVDSMRLKERMSHIPNIKLQATPYGRKDGGELSPREVVKFTKELAQ